MFLNSCGQAPLCLEIVRNCKNGQAMLIRAGTNHFFRCSEPDLAAIAYDQLQFQLDEV